MRTPRTLTNHGLNQKCGRRRGFEALAPQLGDTGNGFARAGWAHYQPSLDLSTRQVVVVLLLLRSTFKYKYDAFVSFAAAGRAVL